MRLLTYFFLLFSVFCFGQDKVQSPTNSQSEKIKSLEMNEMWGQQISIDQNSLSERSALFENSNFAMFIHWGLYSNLAGKWKDKTYYGIGEWIMNPRLGNIPYQEYMQKAIEFNPAKFDARAVAKLAKDAGMKYIIITSKHHEGFAMFNSKASSFNIVNSTPFKRDPMKELSDACKEYGLGFGFYYSHNQDWTAPGATGGPTHDENNLEASFENYFYTKCLPQVKEICSNYGNLDFVWFDTPGNMEGRFIMELVKTVRELQPKAMLCSRVGFGMGDYISKGDMEVPLSNIEGLWETCDTNNDSWSYAWYDQNFKSSKEILQRLISTVARGGSYLFNIGLTGTGEIPERGQFFLEKSGKWIKKYPFVIYGAGSSPWEKQLPWGDVTTQKNKLYLNIYDWPKDGKIYLPGLSGKIASAKLLTENKPSKISFLKEKDWIVFSLPKQKVEHPISVVELTLANDRYTVDKTTGIVPNHKNILHVEHSDVSKVEKKEIKWMEKFGEWKHVNQAGNWESEGVVSWKINIKNPGLYHLGLSFKGDGRLVWRVQTEDGGFVQNQHEATTKYALYDLGMIEIKNPGINTISVSLVEGDSKSASLKSIELTSIEL